MNNELFDRMIKENLQEMQVAPSAGVKKVLGWKLFFQNLVVFHKVKVAMGLLLATSASTFYFVSNSSAEDAMFGDTIVSNVLGVDQENESPIVVEEQTEIVSNQTNNKNYTESSVIFEEDNTDELDITTNNGQIQEDLSSNNYSNSNVASKDNLDEIQESNENSVDESMATVEEPNDFQFEMKKDQQDENVDAEEFNIVDEEAGLFLAEAKAISLESHSDLTMPLEGEDLPSLSDVIKPGIYGELSFDAYKGILGQSEIESYLGSAIHRKYYWDFHGNNDVLSMNVLGGANVNYTLGAGVFRVKANTGVSFYQLKDTKAVYEFHEITDPAWLDFFNTDELAWVNTFGEDTCTQCFYAHSTEELEAELEQEHNQYSYVKIPVQLGTQFNFKYVSLDVLAGMDLNLLTNARGLYVKEGLNPNYERFYYWDDLQLSTLGKENDMLKKSFMTWSVAANLRVRVTKNFDVLAGYQINKSVGSLTKDDYIMDKTLKSSNATIGITYYPFRQKLKEKF